MASETSAMTTPRVLAVMDTVCRSFSLSYRFLSMAKSDISDSILPDVQLAFLKCILAGIGHTVSQWQAPRNHGVRKPRAVLRAVPIEARLLLELLCKLDLPSSS